MTKTYDLGAHVEVDLATLAKIAKLGVAPFAIGLAAIFAILIPRLDPPAIGCLTKAQLAIERGLGGSLAVHPDKLEEQLAVSRWQTRGVMGGEIEVRADVCAKQLCAKIASLLREHYGVRKIACTHDEAVAAVGLNAPRSWRLVITKEVPDTGPWRRQTLDALVLGFAMAYCCLLLSFGTGAGLLGFSQSIRRWRETK